MLLSLRATVSLISTLAVKEGPEDGAVLVRLSPRLRKRCTKLREDRFEAAVSTDVELPDDD